MQGCFDRNQACSPITCLTNPRAGRERDLPWTAARQPRRVLVVGGGVAGMQAALTAARRGHEVRLWERGTELGGEWNAASAAPWKTEDFGRYATYLARELRRLGVSVDLGRDATASLIADQPVDMVFLAVGSRIEAPEVPGDGSAPVYELRAMLRNRDLPPGEHLVVMGGDRAGWEAASWLRAQSKRVTIVVDGFDIGRDYGPQLRRDTQDQVRKSDISILFNGRIESVHDGQLRIDRDGVREYVHDVDGIVVAGNRNSQDGLSRELEQLGIPCQVIGDAREPRDAFRATHEAFIRAYDLE